MWPPPPRPHLPMQMPMMGPPPTAINPYHRHPGEMHHFVDATAVRTPWHREIDESWKTTAEADSWRRTHQHQHHPLSNHGLYRQQYSQLPLSRPYAQFTLSRGPPEPGFENKVPPEYAAHADYEKQLREQYEQKSRDNYNDFSEVSSSLKDFQIRTEASARKIRVSWKVPVLPAHDDKYKVRLVVKLEELEGGIGRGARNGELGTKLDKVMPIHVTRTEFITVPGSLYSVEVSIVGQRNELVARATQAERAVFSIDEMKVLMQKAISFTGTQMQPFTYVYRCKPKIYWDYIYMETGQVMQVYPKDSNGQAASPINQNIHGLFFSARTNPDGSLPNSSPFGDVRMVLPAMTLLDPRRVNLYFSDFYCNRVTHYVTVVVAVKDSSIDAFCRQKLLPLQAFDNPFLLLQMTSNPDAPVLYSVNKKIWVEIYYTENIPMRWGRFDNIIPQGAGTSKIGGLPHNKSCRTCNLYPIGLAAPPLPEHVEPIPVEKASEMVREAARAELVDLVDSDEGSCQGGDNEEVEESNEDSRHHETYGELKRRLEQLDRASPATTGHHSISMAPHEKALKGIMDNIREFLDGMKSDFTTLDARIGHLDAANIFREVDDFIGTLDGTSSRPAEKRSRTYSTDPSEEFDKRRRGSL